MAEINSANSVTGTNSYGNKYTQSVSNDSLTTNDFLKLMIEELKSKHRYWPFQKVLGVVQLLRPFE